MTTTAYAALGAAHPQHITRITEHNAATKAGAIVKIEARQGTETFYTGIRSGDYVVVTDYAAYGDHVSRTVAILDGNAARLGVNTTMTLTPVDPAADLRKYAFAVGILIRYMGEQV